MRVKKLTAIGLSVVCAAGMLTGCGSSGKKDSKSASQTISVVSREDGSGTRGAFIELTGIQEKDADGHQTTRKEGSDCSVRQSTALFIPEPCRVPDDSEIGQGSGKKPDNDGVLQRYCIITKTS